MRILGIPIDNPLPHTVSTTLERFLLEPRFHRIATINPEFLLLAEKNRAFRNALLEADWRLADGIGIAVAFALRGEHLKTRVPGADLLLTILALAERDGHQVFLLIREDGLSTLTEIQAALLERFPRLLVTGAAFDRHQLPPFPSIPGSIVFANFGTPEQEVYLARLKRTHPHIRLAMGVGGAFDFLTGKLPRAPKPLRQVGLEWLWRLMLQPWRLDRILRSVILFLAKVFFEK